DTPMPMPSLMSLRRTVAGSGPPSWSASLPVPSSGAFDPLPGVARYDRSMLTESTVYEVLRRVQEPELGRDIVTLEMVKGVTITDGRVDLTIELTTPACPMKDEIERDVRSVLAEAGATAATITWGAMVR